MLATTTSLVGHLRESALRLAISSAKRIPQSIRFPLQRDGIDPVPRLRAARERGEVIQLARLLGTRVWLVTGYDAARVVLSDSDAFGNDVRHLIGRQDRAPAERIGGLGMTDDPEHSRLRHVLTPYFTRRRLADLQADIDSAVAAALDDLEAHGPDAELVGRFGFAVPFSVICSLLGMGEMDRAEFRELGGARFDLRDAGSSIFDSAAGTREFLIDLVARERRDPQLPAGLLSRLVADHGAQFDDVELGGLADGVFLGGYETSASMLSLGVLVLDRSPQSWELLRTGTPAQVDSVIEELLRFVCPVQLAFPRFARHEVRLGEKTIRQGDFVVVSLSGAGRDPARHARPEDFDPTSEAAATLAFGHGMHRCVGAELARMELRTALVGLARRFPDLRVAADSSTLRFSELSLVYSVQALPVRLWK